MLFLADLVTLSLIKWNSYQIQCKGIKYLLHFNHLWIYSNIIKRSMQVMNTLSNCLCNLVNLCNPKYVKWYRNRYYFNYLLNLPSWVKLILICVDLQGQASSLFVINLSYFYLIIYDFYIIRVLESARVISINRYVAPERKGKWKDWLDTLSLFPFAWGGSLCLPKKGMPIYGLGLRSWKIWIS